MERLPDTMSWLRDRVPLTLLIDLLAAGGPTSRDIFRAEEADLAWTGGKPAA